MRIIILFFAGIIGFSAGAQTTSSEYNYITVGYRAQKKNGLPNKQGYRFEKINNYGFKKNGKEYNLVFLKLIKEENNKLAGIMIEYEFINLQGVKSVAYYCIPHKKSKSNIWNKTLDQINRTNNNELLKAYAFLVTKYAAELSN